MIQEIGAIISDHLRSENLSQRGWAQRVGLSQSTVSRLLSGEQTSLTGADLERLAIGLRRSVAGLVRLDEPTAEQDDAAGRPGALHGGVWDPNRLDLDRWAATLESRRQLPELVWRLILASVPWRDLGQPRFLLGDDAERQGWDGALICESGGPFVPAGRSFWEFSKQADTRGKARGDLAKAREKCHADGHRPEETTVVFVTPQLWGPGAPTAAAWASAQAREHGFRAVRVIDRPQLLHWLDAAPTVRRWFAKCIGLPLANDDLLAPEEFEKRWRDESVFDDVRDLVLPLAAVAAGRSAELAALLGAVMRPAIRSIEILASQREEGIAFAAHALGSHDRLRHRTLVVSTTSAFEAVQSSPERLILVDETEKGLRRLPDGSPHVLIRSDEWTSADGTVEPLRSDEASIHLRYLAPARVHALLDAEGWPPDAAHAAARAADNGFLALRGLLTACPPWASREVLADVWPSLVLGVSAARGEPLGEALRRLAGPDAERVVAATQSLGLAEPMPLEHRGTAWVWRTPVETWRQTERLWLRGNASRILDAVDALLVSESAGPVERGEAGALVRALALVRWSRVAAPGEGGRAEFLAGALVRRALVSEDVSWLETLAETAPTAFLDALTPEALKRHRLPLLWALERLSWASEHFGRVVDRLLMLAAADSESGGGLGNSPLASLHGIMRTRWAGTAMGGETCRQALDAAAERGAPARALASILLSLLPRPSGAMWMGVARPQFMESRLGAQAEGAPSRGRMTGQDLEWLVLRLVETAERDFTVWPALIQEFSPLLGEASVTQCLDALVIAARSSTARTTDKRRACEALRKHLRDARAFSDASWSFKDEAVGALDRAYEALQAGAGERRLGDLAWMFTSNPDHPDGFGIQDVSGYQKLDAENLRRAEEALAEVVISTLRRGERLLSPAELAEFDAQGAGRLGWILAAHPEWSEAVAPELWALAPGQAIDGLRGGYFQRLDLQVRLERLDALLGEGKPDAVLPLLGWLPAEDHVLEWLATRPESIQAAWWHAAAFNPWSEEPKLAASLLSGLLARGGARRIVESLPVHWPERTPAVRPHAVHLRAALDALNPPANPDLRLSDAVEFALDILEAAGTPPEELVALEEKFLALREVLRPLPKRIRLALETSPTFAASIVRETFAADGEEAGLGPETQPARIGRRILFGFDLKFLPFSLASWTDEFVACCRSSGHMVGCAHFLGHILGNLAADPSETELWPPPVVREILKRHDSAALRQAIARAHFNRQGVREIDPHEHGRLERLLAEMLEDSARRLGSQWPESAELCGLMARQYRQSAGWAARETDRRG